MTTHWNEGPERCCLPGAWDHFNPYTDAEPVDEYVIEQAALWRVDPHELEGKASEAGFKPHHGSRWRHQVHLAVAALAAPS